MATLTGRILKVKMIRQIKIRSRHLVSGAETFSKCYMTEDILKIEVLI